MLCNDVRCMVCAEVGTGAYCVLRSRQVHGVRDEMKTRANYAQFVFI